jgi:4-hydroxy-tetrahydrodipicolinate reductase
VVIATTSFLADVAPDVREAVEAGANVITTAEEAAFASAVDPVLATELDGLARARGVSILGTGLNPGFAFDALVLTATGATWSVDALRVERVVDLSGFGNAVLRRIGVGYAADEFETGTADGTITGHMGFPQSMRIVAEKLGVSIERIERRIQPILAERRHEAANMSVDAGMTAGFEQRYEAIVDGRVWFEAVFVGHLDPHGNGTPPRDEIFVLGETPVHMLVTPGLNPQVGAPAVVANSLRRVVAAPPGWCNVGSLPPACPW